MRSALRREFPPGVIPVYLLMALMTTTEGTAQLILPPYLDSYGYALPVIGALVSLLSVTRLASRLPVGAAYGAARAKRMVVAASLGLSLATGGFALADGQLVPVIALTLAHGFAFGSLGTLLLAAIIDMTGGHRAGSIMAWYTAALSTGYSVGAFAGGAIGDAYGLGAAFLIASVLPLAGILVVLGLPGFHGPPRAEGEVAPGGIRGLLLGVRQLDPRVWLAFVIVLYVNLISDAVDAFFPLFGLAIGLTLSELGVLKGLKSAAATVIRFASLAIFRWVRPAAANVWGVVVMGIATVALPLVSAFGAFVALFVVLGFCRGLLRVTTAASVAELRREGRDVGLASGVYNAGLDIGAIIGPTVGGLVANAVGIPLMFQLMAMASLAVYFAVAFSTAAGRASLTFRPQLGPRG
ncbi:MAG: MFS transporter [Candidatus Limnocylindria bacterium]